VLEQANLIQLIKINSKKLDYYIKSDKPVSGLGLNTSQEGATHFELSNSAIDQKFSFWNDGQDYDDQNPGNGQVMFLVYSMENLSKDKQLIFFYNNNAQSPPSNVENTTENNTNSRLLTEVTAQDGSDSSTGFFFSKYEMDENFAAMKGLPMWLLILLILALIMLLVIIAFIIWCCCCRNKNKESPEKSAIYRGSQNKSSMKKKSETNLDAVRTPNTQGARSELNPEDAYMDSFCPPNIQKQGDSKVNHYLPSESDKNKAL
jgi:hypothetical protein